MSRRKGFTRREALGMGISAGLATGLGQRARAAAIDAADDAGVRNIIFMVSDGMSAGVPTMTEHFSRLLRGKGTNWWRLARDPQTVHGVQDTQSLSSLVTDSSAASSAWGSGSRIFNGVVNVLPDKTKLVPIARLARDTRRRVGLVTTTTITHATPAGFAAVHNSRDDQADIAPQYRELVDVLLGGGRKFYDPSRRKDKHDLRADFTAKGYTLWDHRDDLLASKKPARVLGTFWNGHLPFTVDRNNQPDIAQQVPTLAEMTQAALDILESAPNGFLLQIEGGRVDHAAHNNDAGAIFWEQLAFDDAIGVALDFVARRPDTLVLITSDHGNANPGLNGVGGDYKDSNKCFERLTKAAASTEVLQHRLRSAAPSDAIDVVREATGITLKKDDAETLAAAAADKLPTVLNRLHANYVGVAGEILSNYNGIGWTGTTHTSDLVLVMALGAGKHAFAGLWQNTDAFRLMTAMMGVKFENPRMSPDDAKKYLASAPAVEPVHWA